ncbi:MAG TPA: DNRLRE domain-containing protein, partial [Acidimicrobiia bacterium]
MANRRVFRLVAFATLLTATVTTPAIHPAGAATQTFAAEADAKVVQGSPTTNFGTSASLDVNRTPLAESYVRFAVSGLTGSVQQATLRLFAFNGTKNGPGVYRSDPVWSETGINWNNRPARTSAKLTNKATIPANTWVDFDVTAVVTGNGTYSFNVVPDGKDDVQFNSKEATTNKPQLFITLSAPDTTPPNTVINSGPSGTVRADSVSFTFSATEANSTFECSLDGAPFVVCSSPKTYPGLSNGLHTFDVRAI